MNGLSKKMKWLSYILVASLLLSIVGMSQGVQKVFAEDSKSRSSNAKEATIARTGGEQRIDANNIIWTPVSEVNPLGGADDFSAILFDSFSHFNESGGPVVTGTVNNVERITFPEGLTGGVNKFTDYTIPKFNIGLILQKGFKDGSLATQISNGDVIMNKESESSKVDFFRGTDAVGSIFVAPDKIDQFMLAAKSDLAGLQHQLWDLPVNSLAKEEWGTLEVTTDKEINVIEIDPSKAFSVKVNDLRTDSTLIIKVKGPDLSVMNFFVGDQSVTGININRIANRVIWVFDPNEPEMTLNNSHMIGSVLAVNSNVQFVGGYSSINGTIIANSLDSSQSPGSEYHYVGHYIGKLPKNPIDPDPTEPSSSSSEQESSTPDSSSLPVESESSTPDSSSLPSEPEHSTTESSTSTSTSSSSESTSTSEKTITDVTSEPNTSDSKPESSDTPSDTSEFSSETETSESRTPGRLPQTGGSTPNKKPVVGNNQNKQPTTPKQPNKANRYRTLPQTGEGESVIESLLSLVGLGTIFATGFIYVNLYRKK